MPQLAANLYPPADSSAGDHKQHTAIKKNKWGQLYMPLKLKNVLADNGLRQSDWQDAIIQKGGRGTGRSLSSSAGTQILNWNQWPKLTDKKSIVEQTESFLRKHNVTEGLIATIWDVDEQDNGRNKIPVGAKRGPQKNTHKRTIFDLNLPENEMLSTTAKKHFNIFINPFMDDVQSADDIYLSEDQMHVRAAMYQTGKHGGFVAIIGESGSGKTTLRRDLIDRVNRENLPVSIIQPRIIDKGKLTAGSICEAIIRDVSSETPKQSLEAKARQIERILTSRSRGGSKHVLIIEEAHDLTIKTLKYLKRFWELEDGFNKLLAIILIGQPELKGMLDVRQNYDAREVINRCETVELHPLNGNLEQYLKLKFDRADKTLDQVFEDDAFDAIRERCTVRQRGTAASQSMLYPLIVNITVTKAMNLAADMGEARVTAEIIREL